MPSLRRKEFSLIRPTEILVYNWPTPLPLAGPSRPPAQWDLNGVLATQCYDLYPQVSTAMFYVSAESAPEFTDVTLM